MVLRMSASPARMTYPERSLPQWKPYDARILSGSCSPALPVDAAADGVSGEGASCGGIDGRMAKSEGMSERTVCRLVTLW
jgi:hypothetical protein